MSQEFMSEGWFAMVKTLRDEAGSLDVPPALADLIINVTVNGDAGDKAMALVAGMLEEDHHADAPTTMILPADLAKRIFIEGDQSAGMQGFMTGQIRIEGDMSKLMALQTAQPSAAQAELLKKIAAQTA